MTKPRRQHGAVRQLGAINKILRPEPQAQRRGLKSEPGSRSGAQHDRSQVSCGRAQKNGASHSQQDARQAAHNIPEQSHPRQPTELQNRMTRGEKPRHFSPARRFSQGPSHCGGQRRLHSPQQERTSSFEGLQTKGGPGSRSLPIPKATSKSGNPNQLSSEKRKRSKVDDVDEGRYGQGGKKHQIARPHVLQPEKQIDRTPAGHSSSATKAVATPTPLVTKDPGKVVRKVHTQQPSPPSSDGTPEHESRSQDPKRPTIINSMKITPSKPVERLLGQCTPPEPKTAVALCDEREIVGVKSCEPGSRPAARKEMATPALAPDTSSSACQTQIPEATLPSPIPNSTRPQKKKRQNDCTEDAEPAFKRLRLPRDSSPLPLSVENESLASVAEGIPRASPEIVVSPRKHRTRPHQPQSRAVPPDESFAPVTPNPGCDFKILDYNNESVPVLYSVLIKHSNSTELLNCPPEELVFDALDAIEVGFKPCSKYGWPTAIDLLGRTPSTENPAKVLNDVDLYLHEKDGKLYVATDRGLVIVAEYLKLIGVPETQPVRFDGRIPPWAKAALQKREKRRVIQVFGKLRKVKKVRELKDTNATENALKCSKATGEELKKTKEREATHSNRAAEEEMEYEDVLKAERPGDLPLPLGSSIIVYKIDRDDQWAYGRLCDSGEKGWFPISYTCPVDWSLDRFAGSSAGLLDKPLPMSQDPEEKDWNGLVDYIRRQGFPEGPTWKQVCAATASTAARTRAISRAIADLNTTRGCNVDTSTPNKTVTPEATKTPAEQPTSHVVPSSESHVDRSDNTATRPLQEGATAVSMTSILPSTATDTSTNKVRGDAPGTEISQGAEETEKPGTDLVNTKHTPEPAPDVPETPVQAVNLPEAVQEAVAETKTGTATMPGNEEHETPRRSALHQPKTSEPQEDAESASATSARNPFTVPRYDPFARDDDIEYDWDDSDDEEL